MSGRMIFSMIGTPGTHRSDQTMHPPVPQSVTEVRPWITRMERLDAERPLADDHASSSDADAHDRAVRPIDRNVNPARPPHRDALQADEVTQPLRLDEIVLGHIAAQRSAG